MSIKPIDLQTNIGQMTEVSKHEHARQGALIAQQHLLDNEAQNKSILKNTRLDEAEKGEKTSIKDEDKKKDRQHFEHDVEKENKKDENKSSQKMKDDKIGNIIDIFK
jgi:hypothetical protein